MIWLTILLMALQLYLAFLVGYLLVLTIAGRMASRSAVPLAERSSVYFLILVPAHNEEHYLPDLLSSLASLEYPTDLFQVHVVADNCTDQTAIIAQQYSAYVHIRHDREHTGKGYALNWLIKRLRQADLPCNAVVFLDADSIVSPNFLKIMSGHVQRGERIIQAYYGVRDAGDSWTGSLRYASLAVLHFLRPQGRMALGASAGLKGNGMVFSTDVIDTDMWSASLTEDIELHARLLLMGERVSFAPQAIVLGEMPNKLSSSTSQHMRWEKGKMQVARVYMPRLLSAAWQELRTGNPRRAFSLCDGLMEFLLPPFSILTLASLAGLVCSLVLYFFRPAGSFMKSFEVTGKLAEINVLVAVLVLLGQGAYLFAGLQAVSAPKRVYQNLLHAPQLMIWKTWQMLLVLFNRGENQWTRTKRNRSR